MCDYIIQWCNTNTPTIQICCCTNSNCARWRDCRHSNARFGSPVNKIVAKQNEKKNHKNN